VPSTPSTPATSIQNNAVTITWTPPAANGQTIIGYRIFVQQSDGTYSQSLATCDGSTFNVIVSTSCQITVQTLQAAPYNLASGAGVYAKVLAYNSIGDSLLSGVGNGAILVLSYVPGAPTLALNAAVTTKTQIGLSWTANAVTGGQPVIDYRLWSDQASASFVVVASGITQLTYTVASLTTGLTYNFKLEARNSIGYSVFSNVITATAAIVPTAPAAPSTITVVNNVIISWSPPSTQSQTVYGSAIIGYRIYI
jgi:hypothetical protein